jgi:hypothetical protein
VQNIKNIKRFLFQPVVTFPFRIVGIRSKQERQRINRPAAKNAANFRAPDMPSWKQVCLFMGQYGLKPGRTGISPNAAAWFSVLTRLFYGSRRAAQIENYAALGVSPAFMRTIGAAALPEKKGDRFLSAPMSSGMQIYLGFLESMSGVLNLSYQQYE